MNITLTGKTNSGGKILDPGTLLDLPERKARKLIDLGLARQAQALPIGNLGTSPPEPEGPLPAPRRYQVGDRVDYCYRAALDIHPGVIVEAKPFRSSTWYRVKDGDALRWVSENHIQGIVINNERART